MDARRERSLATSRIIAHIDLDSFYASAEIRRNESLKNQPVIIGADPKEGKGRGVALTCNYIARRSGVRSGMPISQAWRLCPQAVFIRPDFEYYELLSMQVMQILRSKGGKFEQVSIDEAFVDLSSVLNSYSEVRGWVKNLKEGLAEKTGLTCSVGVAENKSSAKIATDLNKPDGLTVVEEGKVKEFLKPLPTRAISGVGVKTELLLSALGIKTIGELQQADENLLKKKLGKAGSWLWSVAQGQEREEVEEHEVRSLSAERTFGEDTSDWNEVESVLKDLSSELSSRASAAHLLFRKVGVKIRFQGFETHTRESTLPSLANDQGTLWKEALALLKRLRSRARKIRLVGLRVSGLERESVDQATMTAWLQEKNEGSRSR
ncbi:MAG: DNA polymerase IV [Thaumarchaeota archaeon]|nr:DNA polymerase IV [Nitrososphaerota archaeon]MCS4539204.1 DNA polymerase IV [Nitrososphaerota archaeon]